jgi:1,4-dihydroxy-6-naphthoate synthase
LIHEGQLTHADATGCGPIQAAVEEMASPPLGNAVRRDLRVTAQIARDCGETRRLAHRAPALAHAKQFNRGIGDERTDTFVGMYVNQWTVDYGPRGRQAVQNLLDRGHEAGIIPERVAVDFVG